ncbi:transposase [Akkermansiaceae bacterium]|nr:transposase [Akkermansiaceae bacterium]
MTSSYLIIPKPSPTAMAKERAPKNHPIRLKTGHLQHPSYFVPEKARSTTRRSRANSSAVRPAGRGKTALRYLARYTQRSALGPKRIIGFAPDGKLRLHHTPTGSKRPGILKLTLHEFIRRWLLHVLPKGFSRVRHYGFFASAAIKTRLRIRALLSIGPEPLVELPELPPHTCDHCGGELTFLREIPRPRGPP